MQTWDTRSIDVEPHQPQVLHSDDEGRTIVINLPAGEELQEHQVHERAWIFVVDGEVEIEARRRHRSRAGPGFLALTDAERAPRGAREVATRGSCSCSRPGPARATRRSETASAEPRLMRALLYDIHGNLPALEAVIAGCAAQRAPTSSCSAATTRSWAPGRRRRVKRLEKLDADWIRGNTERWLEDPSDAPGDELLAPRDRVLPRRSSAASAPTKLFGLPETTRGRRRLRLPCVTAQRHADLHAGAHRRRPGAARRAAMPRS